LVLIGLYFLKCTKFDQLILGKIITIVATRCQILTLKCTKIDLGWGSAPDPAGGAYSAPPDPLAGFKETYFSGEEKGGDRRGRQRRGRNGRGARPVCLLVLRGGKGRKGEEEREGGKEERKGKGRRKGI